MVFFKDGSNCQADLVVHATGYYVSIPLLKDPIIKWIDPCSQRKYCKTHILNFCFANIKIYKQQQKQIQLNDLSLLFFLLLLVSSDFPK